MMPIGWAVTIVVLCVAVVALAVVVLGLLRQLAAALERVSATADLPDLTVTGPEIGRPLPHFAVSGPDGEVTSEDLRGRPAVLLFLSEGCGPCHTLAEQLRDSDIGVLAGQLVVVSRGDGADRLGVPAGLRVLAQRDREIADALSVFSYPYAVAVNADGIVTGRRIPNTIEQLESLADATSSPPLPSRT